MQAPGDNIIYQLTNIGASQQPSHQPSQGSPLRTPRTGSAGGTLSRDDSVTPSPSSRGKRWADKLAKFQLHSDKKKATMSPVVSQTISPLSNTHGKRTSSLPRPPDGLESGMKFSPPSKMGMFGHGKALTSSKKSFLNEYCTVCEEPVLNRSSGERIIELECNHISHQECLLVSFENTNGFDLTDFFSIFPPCSKCRTDRGVDSRCIPKNDELKDRLVSIFLIAGNGRRHSEPSRSPLQPMPSLQEDPVMLSNFSTMQHPCLSSPRVAVSSQALPSPQHSSRTPELAAGVMRLSSVPFRARKGSAPDFRREWPISQIEPPIRDSVVSQARTENYSTSASDKLPLYILRVHFMEILLKSFTTLSDWKIDDEFGLLRLVDHLMVSKDGRRYSNSWCMLFEKALVVVSLTDDAKTKPDESLEVTLQDLQIYAPMTNVRVDTVESSVLKLTLQETGSYSWQEIYVTETLHTDASEVIQKWISALLDLDLEFNDKYFTSTLQLPPIIRNDSRTTHLSAGLTGLITPVRVVELASNKRSSVIIKRGFKLSEEQCVTMSTGGTLESVMTNISSILSLKRERPDQLVVVLQLDYDKLKAQKSSLVIVNSLKALGMKFPNMRVCVVNSEGFVKTCGAANEKFATFDEVLSSGSLPDETKFEPVWLKNILYADDALRNLGIAIVSNTPMDGQKSCLLKDYSCFTSVGRRRPKELKIKVGYLNLDYSDKVGELVEVESWENFLEALSYSFSLTFGDDDDEEDISELEELTDSENDHRSDELRSVTSIESTTTILIASPFDGSEINTRSFLADNENSHFASTSYSTPLGGKTGSSYSQEFVGEGISNRDIQDGCDFLLQDIQRAIYEIEQVSSPSHTETSSHPSALYQYI